MAHRFTHIADHPAYFPCGLYLPKEEQSTVDLKSDVMCNYCHGRICLPHSMSPHDVRARQREHAAACWDREDRLVERLLREKFILRAAFHKWDAGCWRRDSGALKKKRVSNGNEEARNLDAVCSACRKVVCLAPPYPTFCDQLQAHLDRECGNAESGHGEGSLGDASGPESCGWHLRPLWLFREVHKRRNSTSGLPHFTPRPPQRTTMSNHSSSGHDSADDGSNPPESFAFDPSLFDPTIALNHFVAADPYDSFDHGYQSQNAYPAQNIAVPHHQPPGNDMDLFAGNAGWSATAFPHPAWDPAVNAHPQMIAPVPPQQFIQPTFGMPLPLSFANALPPFGAPASAAAHQWSPPAQLAPPPALPFADHPQSTGPPLHMQQAAYPLPSPIANAPGTQYAQEADALSFQQQSAQAPPPPATHPSHEDVPAQPGPPRKTQRPVVVPSQFDRSGRFIPNVDRAHAEAGFPLRPLPGALDLEPPSARRRQTRSRVAHGPSAAAPGQYDALGLWVAAEDVSRSWRRQCVVQHKRGPAPPPAQGVVPPSRGSTKRARDDTEQNEPALAQSKRPRQARAPAGDEVSESQGEKEADCDSSRYKQFCVFFISAYNSNNRNIASSTPTAETPGAGPSNLGLNVQDYNNHIARSGTQAKGRTVTIWDGPESERPMAVHGRRYLLNKPRPTDRDWYCKLCYDAVNAPGAKRKPLYWLTVDGARKHVYLEHPVDGEPRHVRERGGGSGTKRKRQPLPPSDEQEDAGSEGEGSSNEG
ncbi:hypothetical protein AURDEDRAFT_128424 [Auricularia subglabra TFB-10046 SS5]|nr:hypothetical protein AURDEDRAFT_128424 [Auricularia subglabra TFB-10046 SS5]